MIEIWKSFGFEAAHRLPKTPPTHKCHNLHGHNFEVRVSFVGEVDENGWLVDFADIEKVWLTIKPVLDHRYLNDVPGLENPTSEVIAIWIWEKMREQLPTLASVEVKETNDCGAIYRGT